MLSPGLLQQFYCPHYRNERPLQREQFRKYHKNSQITQLQPVPAADRFKYRILCNSSPNTLIKSAFLELWAAVTAKNRNIANNLETM